MGEKGTAARTSLRNTGVARHLEMGLKSAFYDAQILQESSVMYTEDFFF